METLLSTISNDEEYKGVRGWLLLFCLMLTVFSVLSILANFLALLALVVSPASDEIQYPGGLKEAQFIFTLLNIVLNGFSFYAGIVLWMIRPNAVKIAKAYLLISLVYSIVYLLVLLIIAPHPFIFVGFLGSLASYLIWHSYLSNSKRVAATYAPQTKDYYSALFAR